MEEERQPYSQDQDNPEEDALKQLELEGRQNISDFFLLLLRVDMRINPRNYNKTNANEKEIAINT